MPKKHQPRFERFLKQSKNDDELLGVVADLVEAGKIAAALVVIGDAKLGGLLVTMIRRMQSKFIEFVTTMKSDAVMTVVFQAINDGRVEDALNVVDSHVRRFSSVIAENITMAGKELSEDSQSVIRGLRPSVGISFDPTNPRAAAAMENQSLDFVRNISTEQKDAIRTSIVSALNEGGGPRETARAYRDAIGLTNKQVDAVNNYRRLLEEGSRQALKRDLRDKRFDPTVKRSIKNDTPLTPEQIDRMVERYRERYLMYRSETIARTESTLSLSLANHESMQQTLDDTGIDPNDVEKNWNATLDKRTRKSHNVLNQKKVMGMNALFVSPLNNKMLYPGDRSNGAKAEDIVNCRCVCSYRIVI